MIGIWIPPHSKQEISMVLNRLHINQRLPSLALALLHKIQNNQHERTNQ
jgi:hypothetical protein